MLNGMSARLHQSIDLGKLVTLLVPLGALYRAAFLKPLRYGRQYWASSQDRSKNWHGTGVWAVRGPLILRTIPKKSTYRS